jgi:hypothetical protein
MKNLKSIAVSTVTGIAAVLFVILLLRNEYVKLKSSSLVMVCVSVILFAIFVTIGLREQKAQH